MPAWIWLAVAIVSEVIATSALKAADGFTRLLPSAVVIGGYAVAFYCLSIALRSMPLGVAYAVWSGVGIALLALVGWLLYGQRLDAWAVAGMLLIVAGIVVLQLSPSSQPR